MCCSHFVICNFLQGKVVCFGTYFQVASLLELVYFVSKKKLSFGCVCSMKMGLLKRVHIPGSVMVRIHLSCTVITCTIYYSVTSLIQTQLLWIPCYFKLKNKHFPHICPSAIYHRFFQTIFSFPLRIWNCRVQLYNYSAIPVLQPRQPTKVYANLVNGNCWC